jgi:hypothetical protein
MEDNERSNYSAALVRMWRVFRTVREMAKDRVGSLSVAWQAQS